VCVCVCVCVCEESIKGCAQACMCRYKLMLVRADRCTHVHGVQEHGLS